MNRILILLVLVLTGCGVGNYKASSGIFTYVTPTPTPTSEKMPSVRIESDNYGTYSSFTPQALVTDNSMWSFSTLRFAGASNNHPALRIGTSFGNLLPTGVDSAPLTIFMAISRNQNTTQNVLGRQDSGNDQGFRLRFDQVSNSVLFSMQCPGQPMYTATMVLPAKSANPSHPEIELYTIEAKDTLIRITLSKASESDRVAIHNAPGNVNLCRFNPSNPSQTNGGIPLIAARFSAVDFNLATFRLYTTELTSSEITSIRNKLKTELGL